jgi:hypothetical protein
MTFLAIWIVGTALTYWLAEREMCSWMHPRQRGRALREISIISLVAWPCALAIYLLSAIGAFGDDDGGDDA